MASSSGSDVSNTWSLSSALPPSCLRMHLDAEQKSAYRYRFNIHHQSEFIFPAIERIFSLAVLKHSHVHTLLVELQLLPWSKSLLKLAFPGLNIVSFNASSIKPVDPAHLRNVVKACGPLAFIPTSRRVNSSCSRYLHAESFDFLRQRAQQQCHIRIPRACQDKGGAQTRHRIGLLNRHTGNRRLSSTPALETALRERYPASDIDVRHTVDAATVCEQIAWFSGVDVLLVAHGLSETNSIFMPHGSTMIELLPWSLPDYCTYRAALKGSGVRVAQVVAHRQPNDTFFGFQGGRYSQAECRAYKACYVWHRDFKTMVVDVGEALAAVDTARAFGAVCHSTSPLPAALAV